MLFYILANKFVESEFYYIIRLISFAYESRLLLYLGGDLTIPKKKIVIVGGGAGGLELATRLGNKLGRKKKAVITLVDCSHSHLWKPLLHEVATGSLDESIDALSYLAQAHNCYFNFQLGTLININRKTRMLELESISDEYGRELVPSRELPYDILVVALGSISNDFGTLGVKDHCIFLDNQLQARSFHNKMLHLFLKHSECLKQKKQVNIAIVGGGATGVELSAELYNAVKQLESYNFKGLKAGALNVTLIEAGERILPALPKRISMAAHLELIKLGVDVLTDTMITRVTARGLTTKIGKFIDADLMVWAAGIKAPDFMKDIGGLETNTLNQLLVKSTLQTTRDPHIFAIGDCASCPQADGGFVPPRAQSAHQMASCCFKNILALIKIKTLKPYVYKDYGSLVSLSRFSTLGILMGNLISGSMMIRGRIARFIYILLYRMHQVVLYGYTKTGLIMLVGIINRVLRPRLKMH